MENQWLGSGGGSESVPGIREGKAVNSILEQMHKTFITQNVSLKQ